MFDGVMVFTATKQQERMDLGRTITRWIQNHPDFKIVDKTVSQSSDQSFHCLSITLFYQDLSED